MGWTVLRGEAGEAVWGESLLNRRTAVGGRDSRLAQPIASWAGVMWPVGSVNADEAVYAAGWQRLREKRLDVF